MATAHQIAANKANSQKSTGPRTQEGKAASSLNHLSHGLSSGTVQLLPGENPEEFRALHDNLLREYQPATPTEHILVEKMACNHWLSLRAFNLQSAVLYDKLFKTIKCPIPPDLGLLIRYQTAADRAFHKAHAELVSAQKERKKSEIGFESQAAAQPPARPPASPQIQAQSTPLTAMRTDFPAQPVSPHPPEPLENVEILAAVGELPKSAVLKSAA